MSRRTTCRRRSAGFSLLELIFAVALVATLTAIAILATPVALLTTKSNGAIAQVQSAFRRAREQAIATRRNIEVRFVPPNRIQVVRREVVGTTEVGTTLLDTVTLEGDVQFQVPRGVPDLVGADDLIAGTGTGGVNVGLSTAQIFTSEGTLVDQTSDVLNLEIFMARRDAPLTARAVTVFGPTALIRGYSWNGRTWTE